MAAVYYVGNGRDAALQREALAREMNAQVPGFAAAAYPDWQSLLERWWRDAPPGLPLLLDEFQELVAASPELPSVLQKLIDRDSQRHRKTVLCGSSQRMMLGLLLDAAAPLYGRSEEMLKLEAMAPSALGQAFELKDPAAIVEHYALWGGVPRYWELAVEHGSREAALDRLVLDPLGVLHREPERLLLDDLQGVSRAASLLALIGQGVTRISEMGGRLGQPATALARPLGRLVELGLVAREIPFGEPPRSSKRSLYRIAEPFLRYWFRFVEPNRSRLGAGQRRAVARDLGRAWPAWLGTEWEELARPSVARLRIGGRSWSPAQRWWGTGLDGERLELDLVATSDRDPHRVLVGEAKSTASAAEAHALLADLERRARRCPALAGKQIQCGLWVLRPKGRTASTGVITAADVVRAL